MKNFRINTAIMSAVMFAAASEGTKGEAAKNPFDFTDVSDLPEHLRKGVTAAESTSVASRQWADVVIAGNKAGIADLNINQIMAAGARMGMEVPTSQTVRGYLNKAVELGYITKPSRQSYAGPKGRAKGEDAGLTANDAVLTSDVADADPLADMG